jgi:sugar/nucleoside kinase (ribokinase family)
METAYDLITIGESVIDFISEEIKDDIGDASRYKLFLGGQVTNLATNVSRLGKNVALATCLGSDGFGRFILDNLQSKGVDTSFVQETASAPTTISIITRSLKTPNFVIHRGADAYLGFSQALLDSIPQCSIVHTSAFALSQDPARSTIFNLLAEAKKENRIITLDPNFHPGIWPDNPDFIDLLKLAFQYATITKPSIEDCHRLLGPGKSPQEYTDIFKSWGANIVIITMGKEGVFLSTQEGSCFMVHPNQIQVTDVTGAGDAFWSGVITGILNGHSTLDSVRAGQVIAEIKLKQLGPISVMPSWHQIIEESKTIQYSMC